MEPLEHKVYTAADIKVLDGLEAVRRRPKMYLGDFDADPTVLGGLIEAAMCVGLDEASVGGCNWIRVVLHPDGSASVEDDGPGLSLELDPFLGISCAEALMTILTACRRLKKNEGLADRLCRVSIPVVTACSEWCRLEVRRDGRQWVQTYRAGKSEGPFAELGRAEATGTRLTFKPDAAVLPSLPFDVRDLERRLEPFRSELPGVQIQLIDLRCG